MIIFTPDPPSKSTSSIVFMFIYTWITTMWLSIAIVVVLMSSITNVVSFSFTCLTPFYGWSYFSFYHKYYFRLGAILIKCPKIQGKIGFEHLLTYILKNVLHKSNFTWRGRRYFLRLFGFVGSMELGILAQLVVHFPIERVSRSSGRLATYICCMVSTIDFFNFSSTS
jgi:hypothetical protein